MTEWDSETLRADLTAAASQQRGFWQEKLTGVTHVVNAAGVLNATETVTHAVHVAAPEAVYAALPQHARGILISAVGIDESETGFARHRRAGEIVAAAHGITILRAGLVLGETSYGGSSLMRALAALPFVTPVIGSGDQQFNPLHAADLARAVVHLLDHPPPEGAHEIGGTQTLGQAEILRRLRGWMGLGPVSLLFLPVWVARGIGRVGDALRWGPISATAVAQLQSGVLARSNDAITPATGPMRGFDQFLTSRPAGTQDLWHARLYLMRPLLRLVLAFLWLASGVIGLTLPATEFLPLLPDTALSDGLLIAMARMGGILDIALGVALLRGWRPRLTAALQAGLVLGYTVIFTWLSAGLWLLPLGGLLKNIPVLMLIAISAILEQER
ncbi:SDR family oxidoreductase [Roseovarius pelagicus]|uniref:SDR family oxidoreductase n=1 Tax=Roseovarius pelagicus TaxID=2980108 RepID=A0ABY6DAE5_9RHOB|nr:SDR family oxidoreductase [Roseovarius pelagicus]UXX82954.1 SDR family oxidoreductase [Roseovarius pelagicus]